MEEQNQQKISLPEIVLLGIVCLGVDLAEIILTLLALTPAIGIIFEGLTWLINAFYWIIITIWLIIKRVRGTWLIAGGLLEFIPGLNALPLRSLTLAITVFLTNKASQIPGAGKVFEAAQKIKK